MKKISEQTPESDALAEMRPDILNVLVANHAEFRRFLSRRLPSEAVADDLLQQSLLKAVEKQGQLEDPESIVAWFYRILKNALVDYYRAHASESEKNSTYLRELMVSDETRSPALDEIKAEVCQCMKRLLPALKPSYAELIQKIDLEERPVNQVAEELKISANNLLVRLHRARGALRLSLVKSCGTCTEHGCLDCTCE